VTLERLASEAALPGADDVAFPLFGIGVLVYQGDDITVDTRWIPD